MVDYRREPTVEVVDADAASLRRFLVAMAGTVVLVAAALVGASLHSNHYGYFGRSGQFAFYNDRLAKVEHLQGLEPAALADAYIVGSSNAMSFLPATVEQMFGFRTFNLGSFWGRAEETWAWSNFLVRDLGKSPRLMIFAVEPWTFANDDRGPPLLSKYRRTLLTTPALARYLPEHDPLKARLSQVLDSLTIENARLMGSMYLRYGGKRSPQSPLVKGGFLADGANKTYAGPVVKKFLPDEVNDYYRRFVASRPGDAAMETLSPERRRLVENWYLRLDEIVNFLPGDRMSTERLQLFEQTLSMLDDRQVPVAIVIMPTHPYYYDMLIHYTRHATHLRDLRRQLAEMQRKFRNVEVVYDGSNVVRFDGDPFEFHDHFHMTPANTNRLLSAMRAASMSRPGPRQ